MKANEQEIIDNFVNAYTLKLKDSRDWFIKNTLHKKYNEPKEPLTFTDLINNQ